MSDAEAAALKLAVESHRYWEWWCSAALVAALLGEVVVALWFREGRSKAEIGLAVGLAAIVAFAVWGEVVFGGWADDSADDLQREAERHVAELKHKTETLRAANLALEQIVQPRRLKPDFELALSCTVRDRYPGQKFIVTTPLGDAEGLTLGIQIFNVLKEAGWDPGGQNVTVRSAWHRMTIGVRIVAPGDMRTQEAAEYLAALLTADDVHAFIGFDEPTLALPADRLEIQVGVKPLPVSVGEQVEVR